MTRTCGAFSSSDNGALLKQPLIALRLVRPQHTTGDITRCAILSYGKAQDHPWFANMGVRLNFSEHIAPVEV